jgi:hypothetical protein
MRVASESGEDLSLDHLMNMMIAGLVGEEMSAIDSTMAV